MKTLLTLILSTLITSTAMAASDSVGVFHRPEKVIIVTNERGESGRIHDFMNTLGKENSLLAISPDESIKIQCKRMTTAASCTFTFFPAPGVQIIDKGLKAHTLLSNLNLESENFEMTFESSLEDKFVLKIIDGNINFFASKR